MNLKSNLKDQSFQFEEQKLLYDWFHKNKRDLPWRRFNSTQTRDPYKTWISEIMLQQTQVSAVVSYFENWVKKFPTLKSLAKSSENEVLEMWAGLGYYSRAKNIHETAKKVVAEYKGNMPVTRAELLSLKGIGEYTVGAILSLAYNQPEPILDGNIIRIFSRRYGFKNYPLASSERKEFWKKAEEWATCDYTQSVNEGLMELGALVCTPKSPSCEQCPIQKGCVANQEGTQGLWPIKRVKKKVVEVKETALYIKYRNKVLLYAPTKKELLTGYLTFPRIPQVNSIQLTQELQSSFELLKEGDFTSQLLEGFVKHTITHHKMLINVCLIELRKKRFSLDKMEGFQWVHADKVKEKFMTALSTKLYNAMLLS